MAEPDDALVEEAVHRGRTMTARDLFDLMERHREGAGVERAAVAANARALADRRDYALDVDAFLTHVDERTTDAEWWAAPDRYYELGDGRLSQYPRAWHDELGGSTDVAEYLEFLAAEDPDFLDDLEPSAATQTISEETLVHLVRVVGRTDRETVTGEIHRARDRGEILEDADQNPHGGVYLPEWASDDESGRPGNE